MHYNFTLHLTGSNDFTTGHISTIHYVSENALFTPLILGQDQHSTLVAIPQQRFASCRAVSNGIVAPIQLAPTLVFTRPTLSHSLVSSRKNFSLLFREFSRSPLAQTQFRQAGSSSVATHAVRNPTRTDSKKVQQKSLASPRSAPHRGLNSAFRRLCVCLLFFPFPCARYAAIRRTKASQFSHRRR